MSARPIAVASSSSGGRMAGLRPHLIVTSNEEAHAARNSAELCAGLTAALGIPGKVAHLECGDYSLVWATDIDDALTGGECRVLIERKTEADFAASITDGRYHSQAARLVASGVPHIVWIVTPARLFFPADIERVESAIYHLQIGYPRTNVFKLRGADEAAFVGALRRIIKYVEQFDADQTADSSARAPTLSMTQLAGAKPKANTQDRVFVLQLCAVHGMSERKACAIAAIYPSMHALMEMWRETRDTAKAAAAQMAEAAASSSGSRKRRTSGDDEGSRKRRVLSDEEFVVKCVDGALANLPVGDGKRLGPALSKLLRECIVPDIDDDM